MDELFTVNDTNPHKRRIESFRLQHHPLDLDMVDYTYNTHPKNYDCIDFSRCHRFYSHPIYIESLEFSMYHNHSGNFALYIIQSNHDHHDTYMYMLNKCQHVFLDFLLIRVHR